MFVDPADQTHIDFNTSSMHNPASQTRIHKQNSLNIVGIINGYVIEYNVLTRAHRTPSEVAITVAALYVHKGDEIIILNPLSFSPSLFPLPPLPLSILKALSYPKI